MGKIEDKARLGAFMRSQLLPFSIVVFIYAVMENLWIYFQPGNQFVPPYYCLFVYNIILVLSLTGLCIKKIKIFDTLNLTLTYFFPFVVEIINWTRLKEKKNGDEFKILDECFTMFGLLKCIKINQIAGFAFFFYAVYVRSKCLEFLRRNLVTKVPLDEFSCNIVYSIHPSEGKIPNSKIRLVMFIFVIVAVLKVCIEEFLIVAITERFEPSAFVISSVDDIFIVASTFLFYLYRSINFNILNMFCSSSWFFSVLVFGSNMKFWLMHSSFRLQANPVIVYMIVVIFANGVPFVWANYTRSLLLDDCGHLACLRRPVPSSNFDEDKRDTRKKPQNDESV